MNFANHPQFANIASGSVPTPASGLVTLFSEGSVLKQKDSSGTVTTLSGGSLSMGASIGSATAGSVFFAGASGVLAQSNTKLFWDNTNNRLAIGTGSASATLQITPNENTTTPLLIKGAVSQTTYLDVKKSDNNSLISFTEDTVGGVINVHANNGVVIGYYRINALGGTSGMDIAGYSYLNLVNHASATSALGINSRGNAGGYIPINWDISNGSTFTFLGSADYGGDVSIKDNGGNEYFHAYACNAYATKGVRFPKGVQSFGFDATASAQVEIRSTTEQLRVGYDASNYLKVTVGATGSTTFDLVGTTPSFVFTDTVQLNSLAGSGDRMVVSNATGVLSTQAIPAGGSGISRSILATVGNTTMGATANTDYIYSVTGAHTMTLPTAVGNTNRYTIKNNHTTSITVNTTSSELIDGTTSLTLGVRSSIDLFSNGTSWGII